MSRAPAKNASMDADALVCVGAIAAAHGVKGLLKVKSFTAEDEDVAAYGMLYDERGAPLFELELVGRAKGALLARAESVRDRDAAEALRGRTLHVPRAALGEAEEGEFFYDDLKGLEARGLEGGRIGEVAAVVDFGAGDLIEIALDQGGGGFLPFTDAFAPEVDLEAGFVRIDERALAAIAAPAREPAP